MYKVLLTRSNKLRLGLCWLFLLLALSTHAQMGKLFDADKQMSSSFTTQVYLDRDGFIWVATRNGLNRYDGYQFQTLKKEKRKDIGMASNYVNCIIQDKNGLFYMGMYGAFQTFDGNRFHDIEVKDIDGNEVEGFVVFSYSEGEGCQMCGIHAIPMILYLQNCGNG